MASTVPQLCDGPRAAEGKGGPARRLALGPPTATGVTKPGVRVVGGAGIDHAVLAWISTEPNSPKLLPSFVSARDKSHSLQAAPDGAVADSGDSP